MTTPYLAQELQGEMDKLLACVHCGLCLPHCPTYVQLGNENDSPRGRLYLMRAVAEGRLVTAAKAYTDHIDLCLGCRACETACPSGVRYGRLLETARYDITLARTGQPTVRDRVTRFLLANVFTSPQRLSRLFGMAKWIRNSRLFELLLAAGVLDSFPFSLQKALAMLVASRPPRDARFQGSGPPFESRMNLVSTGRAPERVTLFAGCVARGLFDHTNEATKKVLMANGCTVDDHPEQGCCGALHAHAGDVDGARQLARVNIDMFDRDPSAVIIVNAAGCGAMLKEYGELLAGDETYRVRASAFSSRVKDISEFLAHHGFQPGPRALHLRVTYDAPCHLIHAQRISAAPLELIRRLPGVDYVSLPQMESCCGSAGIYNLIHPELAEEILAKKLDLIRATGAEVLLTGNAGCLMHIGAGTTLRRWGIEVMHPIDLIAATY